MIWKQFTQQGMYDRCGIAWLVADEIVFEIKGNLTTIWFQQDADFLMILANDKKANAVIKSRKCLDSIV